MTMPSSLIPTRKGGHARGWPLGDRPRQEHDSSTNNIDRNTNRNSNGNDNDFNTSSSSNNRKANSNINYYYGITTFRV